MAGEFVFELAGGGFGDDGAAGGEGVFDKEALFDDLDLAEDLAVGVGAVVGVDEGMLRISEAEGEGGLAVFDALEEVLNAQRVAFGGAQGSVGEIRHEVAAAAGLAIEVDDGEAEEADGGGEGEIPRGMLHGGELEAGIFGAGLVTVERGASGEAEGEGCGGILPLHELFHVVAGPDATEEGVVVIELFQGGVFPADEQIITRWKAGMGEGFLTDFEAEMLPLIELDDLGFVERDFEAEPREGGGNGAIAGGPHGGFMIYDG